MPEEPKNDDSHRDRMARSDYQHEVRAPWGGGSLLRLPRNSLTDDAPAWYFLQIQARGVQTWRQLQGSHGPLGLPTWNAGPI